MPGSGCYLVTPLLDSQGASVLVIAHGDQVEIERVLCTGPCLAQGYCSDVEETRILRVPLTCTITLWQVAEYDTQTLTCYSAACHLVSGLCKDRLDSGVVSRNKRIRE